MNRRPILMLLLGLMLGAALAAGGGWFYMEQVKAKLYHELTVQARIEVEAFMTVTGELVRLYIDLSNLIAQKIGTLFYLQWDKGQVQPRVDTDAFQKEVLSTQVLTNLRRRVNRLKQLLALTSRGLTADLKQATQIDDHRTFEVSPDALLDELEVEFPGEPKLKGLRQRCKRVRAKVASLQSTDYWLGHGMEVLERAAGLAPARSRPLKRYADPAPPKRARPIKLPKELAPQRKLPLKTP